MRKRVGENDGVVYFKIVVWASIVYFSPGSNVNCSIHSTGSAQAVLELVSIIALIRSLVPFATGMDKAGKMEKMEKPKPEAKNLYKRLKK